MGKSAFRGMVSCVLMFLFPGSLFAADSNAAMLYTNGAAWVNGAHVPRSSSAIFLGDLLQTRSDSVANINQAGSSITVLADSLVQFQGTSVDIQHGGVTVATSKEIFATAGDIKVTPKSNAWTEFRVIDTDGTVRIHAEKGDLLIDDGSKVVTLAQGQADQTVDENNPQAQNSKKKGKNKKQATGAAPAAGGGILSSPYAVGIGAGAIIGVTTWVLIKNDNPASPTRP
ncbi:MAG: hypothetical protein ABSH02_00735 [Candidatus Sulfotelmatobacter sp.]|jgi:hypothetical protein